MKKSLGDKRRELQDGGTDLIVSLFGEMLNGDGEFGEFSKILPVAEFGYRRITVERPLRLSFDLTEAGRERLRANPNWLSYPKPNRDLLSRTLDLLPSERIEDRAVFTRLLKQAASKAGVKLTAKLQKDACGLVGERDPNAAVCRDNYGQLEPDVWLRDDEQVPLKESWQEFFAREVTPFAPDAWVNQEVCDQKDGNVGIVGYEIPVSRIFYRPKPVRPLQDINGELKVLAERVAGLLGDITG